MYLHLVYVYLRHISLLNVVTDTTLIEVILLIEM